VRETDLAWAEWESEFKSGLKGFGLKIDPEQGAQAEDTNDCPCHNVEQVVETITVSGFSWNWHLSLALREGFYGLH